MKKLAIIGGGRMAGIFAKNAKELGIETYCFSPAEGIIEPDLFDNICNVNVLDIEKVLNECIKVKIDGVVATTELTILAAAYVAEKMNLVGIPYEVSKVITDKYRNREFTKNIPDLFHPKFAKVNSIEEIKKIEFNYPIILKPTSKGGKKGISVINNESEIEKAFDYAYQETNGTLPFIIEEFIEGEMECSVESLSYNGKNYIIQVTEKITSGAPHCVELAHHQPANISEELRNKIEIVLDKALTAVGILNGACHTEIKISNNNIYLIEFNARPGGDHIAYPLTGLSTGYEYIKGAIKIALNEFEPVEKRNFVTKYAGVLFVTEQTRYLKEIFDKCEKYDWCYKKNYVSDQLECMIHNDGFNKNYFIYYANERPEI